MESCIWTAEAGVGDVLGDFNGSSLAGGIAEDPHCIAGL